MKKYPNTKIRREDGKTIVRLYSTDILEMSEDYILLRTGGHSTVTTKRRMNQVLQEFEVPGSVFSIDYQWFFKYDGDTIPFIGEEVLIPWGERK